jgi:hypothetical protein
MFEDDCRELPEVKPVRMESIELDPASLTDWSGCVSFPGGTAKGAGKA